MGGFAVKFCRLQGQALTESLVALALLVPLFTSVWYVASLQDLSLAAIGGARYGFLSAYATDRLDALPDLQSRINRESPVGQNFSYQVSFSTSTDAKMPTLDRVQSIASTLLMPVQELSSERLDIPVATAQRLEVKLTIEESPWSGLQSLLPTIHFTEPVAVVMGSAMSPGNSTTLKNLRALSVSAPFEAITLPVTLLRPALEVLEPSFSRFCPGRLDPDIVPSDRLFGTVRSVNDLRQSPCR